MHLYKIQYIDWLYIFLYNELHCITDDYVINDSITSLCDCS